MGISKKTCTFVRVKCSDKQAGMKTSKKVYFISDSHLGVPDYASSLNRERMMVSWLDMASEDAEAIFLLGDVFDFWFEYRFVVPKGYVRLLGKLAMLADRGIPIHYFTGNHDLWAFDYFEKELGLILHRQPIEMEIQGKRMYIGHGDGLGPGDHGYKMLKKFFSNRSAQKLFSMLHPGIGVRLALYFSKKSRIANGQSDKTFYGPEKEALLVHCSEVLAQKHIDYFIFGHRHYPICMDVHPGSQYINTGDWVTDFTYAVMEEGVACLKQYKPVNPA